MSIRKIFSRSTGTKNRHNESRKVARRQNLRKRLLGHETLEDRRLLTGYIVDTLVDQTYGGGDFATETTGADAGLSLREAIGLANANDAADPMGGDIDGDTITFDPALAGGVIMIDGNGELEIYDDVAIDGVDAPGLTIDGGSAVRIFYIDANGIGAMDLVEFANLTLNAGNTAGSIGDDGGAIEISPGDTVRLDTVTISNSRADDDGGGIYNAGGTLTIVDSLIEFNSAVDGATGSGGGIASADGAVTITDTTIRSNEARRAGGGIEIIDGSLDADGMTLGGPAMADGNVAGPVGMAAPGNGGGIHVSGTADVTLVGGTVQYNQARLEGGGLWNQAGATMTLEDGVIVSDNVAAGDAADEGGGGIFNNGGTLTLNGTLSPILIEDNAATGTSGSGGGIFSTDGTVTVDSSIVRRNLANRAGGGIEIVDGMLDVAGTTIGGGPLDGNNAIGGGAGPGNGGGIHISGTTITNVTNSTISYNMAASEGGGLWNGATGTMVLESTAGPVLVENNQAGGADPDNGGGGIFNAGGVFVIDNAAGGGISISNNIADGASGSGGGIFNDVGGSLFVEAVVIDGNMAERAGGGIEDNSGGATTITLIDVLLDNNDAIGTGAAPGNGGGLHVSGDGNVDIIGGTVDGNTAALEGGGLWNGTGTMTIDGTMINGNTASGDTAADDGGGGIFNSFGGTVSLLNNVAVTNNIADGPTFGSGGGILNLGDLTVDASGIVITGNRANRAGGGVEHNSPATLGLTNVTLDNNNAGVAPAVGAPGNGGGLHITGGADSSIIGGTVSGNTAALEGGGLWNGTGTMTIDGTIIDGNTASGDGAADDGGGGIFNSAGGTVSLLNNVAIVNNIADGPTFGSGGGILNLGELTVDASGILIADNRANRAGGGIEHNSPTTLTLTNVFLFGNNAGVAPAVAAPGNGGGLHITGGADSHISDSMVVNNAAALEGGGLWNGTGTMTIDGATIIDGNTASGDAAADDGGGGIFNAGGTVVVNAGVSISNNDADGATNGSGGGILNDGGTLIITGALISNNSAQRAGGGIEDNGGLGSTILDSTIRGNTALGTPGRGGGIHITGGGSIGIDGSTLNNNTAQEGGGLWNSGSGTFTVTNSTISGNTATTSDGGGIFNTDGGTVDLDSVTITLNSGSGTGDGIFGGTGGVTIENTIVAQNPGGGTEANLSGTITSQDFNLIGDPNNGTLVGGTLNTIFSADALLLPLTNTGGATETHLPAAGSPAIGFGSTTLTVDQRDVVRPQGAQDDIGAVEADLNGFVVDAGGQAGDGNADEFLIRNDAGGIGGNVEVLVNGVVVFSEPKATTGLIVIRGSADDDTLVVDNSNGLIGARIVFDGDGAYGAAGFPVAGGFDTLRLIGSTPVTTTYNPGETNDAGALFQENNQIVQTVEFFGLEPLQVLAPVGGNNILNVASAPLGVGFPQALNAANSINYTQGPNSNDPFDPVFAGALTGLITVDGFESLEFANFEVLNIDAGAGSDEINLNNPVTPNELGTINVNGGDPTAGSDTVVINGTAADDTFAYTPTSTNGGTVVQGGAITMTYNLATVESLAIDAVGQAATDALTVTTANATIMPGTDPGTGVVDPVSAAGDPLLSLDYAGMETATVTGTTAVVQGTAENDTITVSAAGVVTVTNQLGFTNSVDVSAFAAVVINALGGDDSITISGAAVFAGGITVLGGDNGTSSDELNLTGAAATAETVNISPSGTNGTNQTITGLGSTITVDGTELIVYDSTGGDDTLEVDPDFGSTMRIDSAPRANYDRAVSDSLPEIQWTNLLLFQATPGGATNDYTTTFVTSGLFGATSYELNPQTNDQTLVIEGDGNADSFTLVNPATGQVSVTDDNRGITVTSIGVGLDLLRIASLGGDDTVTVNVAPDVIGVPIEFNGGAGSDALTVTGTPATAVDEVIYSPGAAVTEGRLAYENAANATLMTIDFSNLEPVVDLVPAATLTVNGTNSDNAINYDQSPNNAAWGRVSVDGFETIEFAQKQNLTINGLAGSDEISLNNPTAPAGLTSITVNGGDPTTSSDSVEIIGTAADDTFAYTPTSTNGGTVVQGGAITMTYNLATIESLAIDAIGQAATDALTVTTANATITPGTDPGTGVVDPVSAAGDPLLALDYAGIETATVTGTTAVVQGTGENDTITVSAAGVVTVTNELGFTNSVDVSAFGAVVINALGGDDAITIDGAAVFAGGITVLGGDNGTSSDELNLTGAAATAETVNISPSGTNGTSQTITGLGSTITVDGTELVVYDATGGDDTLVVDPDFGSTMRIDSAPKANYDRAVSDSLPEIQWTNLLLFQATPGGATNDYTTTFVTSGLFGATSYELNPQTNDQTLVIEGDGNADSFTLVNPATGEVEVTDDNRGITVTSIGAGLDLLRIVSLGGDDTVTVNVAPDVIGVPIEFDGGDGSDLLTVSGTPATAVDEVIYSPGAAVTEGRLVYENAANATLMTIDFANLEPVVDLVPAATLTVNATNADNAVNYSQSPTNAAWGRVSVDGFETIDFAQKQNLTLNGLAGDDTINLNNPTTPAGLTTITVNGGDPTASDTVIVNGTTGVDAIVFAPTSDDDATVTGAGPVPITLATVEHAVINAQGNTGDTLTYETPAGEDHVYLTPGSAFTSGSITAQREVGTILPLMSLSFTNFVNFNPGALAFNETGGGDTDDLYISGTQHDDVFTVDSTGAIEVRSASDNLPVIPQISSAGVDHLTLRGLDGDDIFNVPGDHPYTDVNRGQLSPAALVIEGGNPDSGSDVLNFTSAGAAVTVDLGLQTVTEAGFTAVAYSGIETINADAGGVGLNVVATTEDDDVTVTVLDANSGNVEHGYTMNRLGQPISAAEAPLVHYTNTGGNAVDVDLAGGQDTLNVVGNARAQTFNVDVTTSTVAIDDAPVVGNDGIVTYTNNESLGVFGLEGDDTFDVTPGLIPVFIDGGDPIGSSAGDTINTNAGGAAVTFEGGPENDEGGILVAGSERISYDHIEALGAIAAMKALIIGTNGDDDITVIARDASTHALADGVQDFTVSVNAGPAILFVDTPELYIDALSGDDDIVLRTPAPNDASWDVEVFIAGGTPSDGAPNEGDRLVLETPGNDTIIYTPTGSDTGTILIDEDGDGINDGVIPGGVDSLITIGQFNVVCPGLNYTSDPGGVELFEYDGEGVNDAFTIIGTAANDTITHTPGSGIDEGTLRVNTLLAVDYQNLGPASVVTVDGAGQAAGGRDRLVVYGTSGNDVFDVAATSGAVTLRDPASALVHRPLNTLNVEALTLEAFDGDDSFVINTPQPYAQIAIAGASPGASDRLSIIGAVGTAEAFTVSPGLVPGEGRVNVDALSIPYRGIEHLLLGDLFGTGASATDSLVINDDFRDNTWNVGGGLVGDLVQIEDRESIDISGFDTVELVNQSGTDHFRVAPTNMTFSFLSSFTISGDAAVAPEPADDVLELIGTEAADVITATATTVTVNGVTITAGNTNFAELRISALGGNDIIGHDGLGPNPAPLALALPGVRKVIDAGDGNDIVNASNMQDPLIFGGLGDDNIVGSPIADLIYGGSGNDIIFGLGGNDTIYGDEGNDTITGGTGDDNLFGGADSDLLIWNNGDNTDLMEGGTGNDRVQVNGAGGAAAGENYVISANGSRVTLQRTNLVPFTLDIAQVEQLDLNTDDSADDSEVVTVNSLVGTEIEVLNLDAGIDSNNQFIFNGNDSAETISIGPNEQILGLGPVINTSLVVGGGFSDTITINAAGGADTITVTDAVDADLVLNGGLGNDVIDASLQQAGFLLTINGDAGDDLLRGGAGNDIINGGAGEDSMVGNLGLDTFDGGAGFDTILVEGFASDDRIDVRQDNPTTLRHEVGNANNGFDGVLGGAGTETDTLVINTVEQVSITAGAGDDTIRVAHDDSLVAAGVAIDMLRFHVDGGDPGASDRLTVTDDGLGDTTVQRLGQTDGDGSFTMYAFSGGNPANPIIALPPVVYTDVEYASLNPIGPVTGGTGTDSNGRLFVFKYDPFEQNQSLPTATFLGADSTINLDPNIDPGWDVNFNTPGDEDWYRVVAEKTGTLDFQVYFRQQGLLNNGRAGLPGNGDLEIAVYDADGLVGGVPLAIAGTGAFGANDADDNERVRIPAVAGQTYYLRVVGAALAVGDTPNASPAINAYNVSVVNTAPPVPYDLELNDILQVGTVSVNAANTITFTATLAPNNPSLAAPTIANDYIGKTVEFTSGPNIGRQATILNFAAGTFTLNAVGNALIAPPQAGDSFLVETTDTGRSQLDDATRDNTPVITFRLDDDFLLLDLGGNVVNPNVAPDQQIPIPFNPEQTLTPTTAGYRVPVFIEGNPQQPGTAPQTPIGYARPLAGTPGVYIFDFGVDAVQAVAGVDMALVLTDGSHFINAKVEITDPSSDTVTDFAARSESLEIIVDTDAPEVYFGDPAVADDGLHPNSDSGVPFDPATLSDNATNDTTPTFFGRAEANSIIRAYVDRTNNGFTADDLLIGQTVASPLDGSNQHPFGEWEITSTVNMNDPLLTANLGLDGVRNIYVTAEDVEGNTSDANLASLQIFIDTSGPQVTDVFITNRPDFDLFTLKPQTPEPTPRVDSITINVRDLPARVAGFLYPAIANLPVAPAVLPLGLIQLTGDHSGIIPMTSVTFTSDGNLNLAGVQPLAVGNPATGFITLQFADPLPDDRFTLTLSDSIVDPAGNALDGESNASEPVGTPLFPSGDGIPGGDFIARFTVDSRPEVGTWSQELVYIDINGNFVWDPEGQDNDATNRDFIYHFGTTTDAYFAGNFNSNFVGPDGIFETPDDAPVLPDNVPSSGFDKMGTFGRFNGLYEFFLDTNDDGIGDTVGPMFYQVNVIPVAGNFFNSTADSAAVANGQRPRDEIGGFDGQNWYLDVNGDNAINAGERFATELRGIPVVGDFNGDGNDDLATFNNATGVFQFDLDRDGTVDDTLTFFFSGFGEKPVAGDVNLDGIDDIVLWVPNRDGQLPENAGEFHYLVSDNPPVFPALPAVPPAVNALPSAVFNSYSPAPLGNDLIAQFGDDFALPILGNFDPPIGDIDPIDTTGWFTNLNNSLDVDNDGHVDSYDALLVINALNRGITSAEPSQAIRVRNAFNGHFLDVDGSTSIDPYDVLLIINELNRVSRAGQGEAAPSTAASYAAAVDSVFSSDEDDDDLLLDFADNDALRNTL